MFSQEKTIKHDLFKNLHEEKKEIEKLNQDLETALKKSDFNIEQLEISKSKIEILEENAIIESAVKNSVIEELRSQINELSQKVYLFNF